MDNYCGYFGGPAMNEPIGRVGSPIRRIVEEHGLLGSRHTYTPRNRTYFGPFWSIKESPCVV